jgi:hypothetical protein
VHFEAFIVLCSNYISPIIVQFQVEFSLLFLVDDLRTDKSTKSVKNNAIKLHDAYFYYKGG